MEPNPFSGLVHSRKFWLLVLDTLISLVLYFVGKYGGTDLFEDIKFLIISLQPVFVAIIWAIAHEDAANVTALGWREECIEPPKPTS
jgi:hypothetical protein